MNIVAFSLFVMHWLVTVGRIRLTYVSGCSMVMAAETFELYVDNLLVSTI